MFLSGFLVGMVGSWILFLFFVDEPIFEDLLVSVKDKHETRKERKLINTLNEKYKTGMVVGVFCSNPYVDVPYWIVTSERINMNGEKYVELKLCDKYGNYEDTAEPLVFSVSELYRKKYVVVQNKK